MASDFDLLDQDFVWNILFAQLEWKHSEFCQNDVECVPIINVDVKKMWMCANLALVIELQRANLAK